MQRAKNKTTQPSAPVFLFSPEPYDVCGHDCCAGQIAVSQPCPCTSGLRFPPTTNQDVSLWGCSKNTISHMSARPRWAAAPPCNMVCSVRSQRHRKCVKIILFFGLGSTLHASTRRRWISLTSVGGGNVTLPQDHRTPVSE